MERKANLSYKPEWVKAHQDDDKDLRSLSRQGALNVRMDNETKVACIASPMTDTNLRINAIQWARDQIVAIYQSPPYLASHFRSIVEVPLEYRLKVPLQAAEQWLSLITHQSKVTNHNQKILLPQPLQSHFRTMRRKARQQAKDRSLPEAPYKAHSRAVQVADRHMREALYAKKATKTMEKQNKKHRWRSPHMQAAMPTPEVTGTIHPLLRHHPP